MLYRIPGMVVTSKGTVLASAVLGGEMELMIVPGKGYQNDPVGLL